MEDKSFVRMVAKRTRCDERRAEALIFAVFQELRDRLTPKEASDVASQLPMAMKHLWMSFEQPNRQVRRTHEAQFVDHVRRAAGLTSAAEAEHAVVAVFHALQEALGSPSGQEGEAWDVFSQLPMDLKKLWLLAAQEAA
jgi:uncharacterized protein (DUF2267 family)